MLVPSTIPSDLSLKDYRQQQQTKQTYICNRVYCIHVSGDDPLIFSFLSFILFDWVGVLWPQLSKVLKPVRQAGSVPFPPVSLQRQVVCLSVRPVFMCSSQRRAYTVSWLVGVQIKVMLQQPLTCGSSSMLPTCFPQLLPDSWCFTSTEARWPIRDGDRVGRGRPKPPEKDRRDRGPPPEQWKC